MSYATKGVKQIPTFVYGTAWKGRRTRELVDQAIKSGFRAVDTAAQPKHYAEQEVGKGLQDALNDVKISRDDLWIQTKFTPLHGQDRSRMPYEEKATLQEQITSSFASSLSNFDLRGSKNEHTQPYLDAVLLHSPYPSATQTIEAWTVLSSFAPDQISTLGISNVSLQELQHLWENTTIKPSIVQNSFHAGNGYDGRLRAFCREKGIIFQSFWTLTANQHLLQNDTVTTLAHKIESSPELALYALVGLGLDIRVLNGTTNPQTMSSDLLALDKIRTWRAENKNTWMSLVSNFKGSLNRGRIL